MYNTTVCAGTSVTELSHGKVYHSEWELNPLGGGHVFLIKTENRRGPLRIALSTDTAEAQVEWHFDTNKDTLKTSPKWRFAKKNP